MKPLKSIRLSQDASNPDRIGDNQRNKQLAPINDIESIITSKCPLTITCDVRPIHPPYFTEYVYHDVLNGIGLTTMSAEITCRMSLKASSINTTTRFPIGECMDKYTLIGTCERYRKVIFLPGSNSLHLIDQSSLQKLMMEDDEWVIKLHPITNESMIRDLASIYGYHRLIDRRISGMELLEHAEQIASTAASELYILAKLLGKPVIDLTRYDKAWLCSYYYLVQLCDGSDQDAIRINNALMSDLSGHLRYSYTKQKNTDLAENYYQASMEEREKFRMVTNQRLIVSDKTFIDWK